MIARASAFCVLLSGTVLLSALNTHAGVFVVDAADGHDANSGKPSAPFATVERGIDVAAERAGHDTVIIREGLYVENVVINDTDSLILSGTGAQLSALEDEDPTIAITSGQITIRGLAITGGEPGVLVEPRGDAVISVKLLDCAVGGNNGRGVSVEQANEVRIVGGTYNGNDGDGIKIERADSVFLQGAEIADNDSDGLDLEENGSMILFNLIVNGNGDEGIEVDDSESIFLQGCQVSGNDDDGLDLDNTARVMVVNCVSSGNGDIESQAGSGLQIEADDERFPVDSVTIINSVFSANVENGIHILEDGAAIGLAALTMVTAEDNQLSGIRVEVTGDVRIHHIVSNSNGEGDVLP